MLHWLGVSMRLFIVLALLIAIAIVLFALQNSSVVTISFLSFHYSGSLALIVVALFASGLLAGLLISLPSLLRKSSALREQKRKVKQFEESSARSDATRPIGKEKSDKKR
jgi:lipopolysaccharide assembly protein A